MHECFSGFPGTLNLPGIANLGGFLRGLMLGGFSSAIRCPENEF